MKIITSFFAAVAFVLLSVSSAWAAETPKPGKTPEETAFNKGYLACKTQWPGIVEATTAAFKGESLKGVRAIFAKRFERDKAAGVYYAQVYDKNAYVDNVSENFHKLGADLGRDENVKALTASDFRKMFSERMMNAYVNGCAPIAALRLME